MFFRKAQPDARATARSAQRSRPAGSRLAHGRPRPERSPHAGRRFLPAWILTAVAAFMLLSGGCSTFKNGYDSMMKALNGAPKTDEKAAGGKDAAKPVSNRYALDIQYLDVGMPLPRLGKNLAVVLSDDGRKCVGLNGVSLGEAFFSGRNTRNFEVGVNAIYNFPIREGGTVTADLLNFRLGSAAQRRLSVTITQNEGEPPTAVFSVGSSKYAQDMYCSRKPIRWKEDIPNAMTRLVIRKEAGGLRFEYDGELVCTSPLEPTLALSEFSALLTGPAMLHDVAFTILPDGPGGNAPARGGGLAEAAAAGPFPATEISHGTGMARIDLSRLTTGSPIGKPGQNMIVLSDEEGRYVSATSPDGANVLFPADVGSEFSVRVLAKDAFVLSERDGRTGRFPLFSIYYKNGFKEFFVLNLTRDASNAWLGRYVITRQGPDGSDLTTTTDFRPFNNALDFNEYKVIKEKGLIRFFFNGEFVRNEPTKGDVFAAAKVDLRQNERLYDIVVRDLKVAGGETVPVSGVKEKPAPEAPAKPGAPGKTPAGKAPAASQPASAQAAPAAAGQAPDAQAGIAPAGQAPAGQVQLGVVRPYDEVIKTSPPVSGAPVGQPPAASAPAPAPDASAPAKGD